VSLTLVEEYRLMVFGNWVLKRKFGPKREEVVGVNGEDYIMRSFITYASPYILG
jgi:hypothetical protein